MPIDEEFCTAVLLAVGPPLQRLHHWSREQQQVYSALCRKQYQRDPPPNWVGDIERYASNDMWGFYATSFWYTYAHWYRVHHDG